MADPIDASELDRRALSSLKVGTLVTNINGTSSVWRVVAKGGVLKRVSAQAEEAPPSDD